MEVGYAVGSVENFVLGSLGMEDGEPDAQFTVAVEDFGGAWATVAQACAALCPVAPPPHACCFSLVPVLQKALGLSAEW